LILQGQFSYLTIKLCLGFAKACTDLFFFHRGLLKLRNQKPKYQITSPSSKLAETEDVKLYVHYNVQPWVGILSWTPQMEFGGWKKMKGGVSKVFRLPALKVKEKTTSKS
jgi:hypothetical protein